VPRCLSRRYQIQAQPKSQQKYQSAGQMGLVTDGASGEVPPDESGGDDAATVVDVEARCVQGIGV